MPEFWQPVKLRTGVFWSLYGVWYRHYVVYCKTLLANITPPILEPLFFFTAVAIGLATYMKDVDFGGLPYRTFVASGLVIASAMFTAIFETTFSTFVRLVFQKTYDAMLGTHLHIREMFLGEVLFAATKGAAFATIVMGITWIFGAWPSVWCVFVPVIGFFTSYLFANIGLIVTSYVKTINNFSFFTSGVVTPLFFFSGTFFPILWEHHWAIDVIALLVPLTHCIELTRVLYRADFAAPGLILLHAGILAAYIIVTHIIAIRRMTRRVLK